MEEEMNCCKYLDMSLYETMFFNCSIDKSLTL